MMIDILITQRGNGFNFHVVRGLWCDIFISSKNVVRFHLDTPGGLMNLIPSFFGLKSTNCRFVNEKYEEISVSEFYRALHLIV